ncbi:MAG: hypothetical protein LBG95_01825 [Treponema sp.]|jgi:hypothetical protein|nr:hypothetical protein [Treponema sp.]
MNKQKIVGVCVSLLYAFFISGCDWEPGKSFDYNMQGTWVSNASGGLYSGELVIDIDSITIKGYEEDYWMSLLGDDEKRPFRNFPKNVPLEAYTEEGCIFIKKAGVFQDGIPYVFDDPGYGRIKLLYLSFGGREEILQKNP